MSVDLKCDRCGETKPVSQPSDALASIASVMRNQQTPQTWATVMVSKNNVSARTYHLCPTCKNRLESFMAGQEVDAITRPLDKAIVLQHKPAADCHLIWDPHMGGGNGGYICSHDEPDRFHFLAGQAAAQQSVARDVAQADWDEALGRVKPASADVLFQKVTDSEENEPKPPREVRRGCKCDHAGSQHGPFGCGYLGGCKCTWSARSTDDDVIPDEEPECSRCNHAPHRKDGCAGIVKTKKPGGSMVCPCTGGMKDAAVPTQRQSPEAL